METRKVTLATCVLNPGDLPAGASTDLMWRHKPGSAARWDAGEQALSINGQVSFLAYLNLLSMPKLTEYCGVDNIELSITVKGGSFILRQISMDAKTGDMKIKRLIDFRGIDAFATATATIDTAGFTGNEFVSFEIECEDTVWLKTASYSTVTENAAQVDGTRLLLATTTYRKEGDIARNAARIRRDIVEGFPEMDGHFKMVVIDNAGTLDAKEIGTDGGEIKVIESPNIGGAGGFAQGMMLAYSGGYSHVLLMDDDVLVLPEAIRRAYAVAALSQGEYRERGVLNGAMFRKEEPNVQFEDVAEVCVDGTYRRIKPDFDMTSIDAVVSSELTSVDVPNAYGAWWFSMIPTALIEKAGLPLPVFVRCDDVEFGMRAEPKMMSMAGVCTWHDRFEGRMNYASDCYQYTRNFLIMNAVDGLGVEKPFMMRLKRSFRAHLRSLAYDGAEMIVEGLEDYMRGPEFLLNANGSLIMRTNLKRNEKMDGCLEADDETRSIVEMKPLDNPADKPMAAKLLTLLPYTGNRKHFRHKEPTAIYYWMGSYPGSKANARNTLIAVSDDGARYAIRRYDRDRYEGIIERYETAIARYADDGNAIRESWAAARDKLRSANTWLAYIDRMKAKEPERFGKNDPDDGKAGESADVPDVAAGDETENAASHDTESAAAADTAEN